MRTLHISCFYMPVFLFFCLQDQSAGSTTYVKHLVFDVATYRVVVHVLSVRISFESREHFQCFLAKV